MKGLGVRVSRRAWGFCHNVSPTGIGDIRLDGDCAVAELVGKRVDPIGAAAEQREAVAGGCVGASGGRANARLGAGDNGDAAGS